MLEIPWDAADSAVAHRAIPPEARREGEAPVRPVPPERRTAPPADPAQQDPDLSTRWNSDIATQARQRDFVNHRFQGMKDAPVLATHACHYELTRARATSSSICTWK